MRKNDLKLKLSLVKAVDLLYSPMAYSIDNQHYSLSQQSASMQPKNEFTNTVYSHSSIGTGMDSSVGASQVGQRITSEPNDKNYQLSGKYIHSQESFNEPSSSKYTSLINLINPQQSDINQSHSKLSVNPTPRKSYLLLPKKSTSTHSNITLNERTESKSKIEATIDRDLYHIETNNINQVIKKRNEMKIQLESYQQNIDNMRRLSKEKSEEILNKIPKTENLETGEKEYEKIAKKKNITIQEHEIQDIYGFQPQQVSHQNEEINNYVISQDKTRLKRNNSENQNKFINNNYSNQNEGNKKPQKIIRTRSDIENIDNFTRLGQGEWKMTKEQMGEQQWQERINKLKSQIKNKMPAYSSILLKKWENYEMEPNNYNSKRNPKNHLSSLSVTNKTSSKINFFLNDSSQLKTPSQDFLRTKDKVNELQTQIQSMETKITSYKNKQKLMKQIPNELIEIAKKQSKDPFFHIQNLKKEKNTHKFFPQSSFYSTQEQKEEEDESMKNLKQRSLTYKAYRNHIRSYLASFN